MKNFFKIIALGFVVFSCDSSTHEENSYVTQEVSVMRDGGLCLTTTAWHDKTLVRLLLCYEDKRVDKIGDLGIYSCIKLTDSVKRAQWIFADEARKDWIQRITP